VALDNAVQRFIAKVLILEELRPAWDGTQSGCWAWDGAKNGGRRGGYGNVKHDGRWYKSHILSYILFVGPIPDGYVLLHSCDYPPCCNPGHLKPGTRSENTQDMIHKGRAKGLNKK